MGNSTSYHLVLEARPKDFMPVDINLLLNNKKNYHSLNAIDEFTKEYTLKELYQMIEDSNIVPRDYLGGKLEIINDNKYRFPIMTKDINFTLDTFLSEYITNKRVMNKFFNIYIKYCSDTKELMKEAINKEDVGKVLALLFKNPYESIRGIYFYIYENIFLKINE